MKISEQNILIIIPARGGSKGIPQKNISLLDGKPLIFYAIENAKSIKGADIFVSTDDKKIKAIASVYEVNVLNRPDYLSGDKVTIDEVISYDLMEAENVTGKNYDVVITLQPTSPLLQKGTLQLALHQFENYNYDTLISAGEHKHLTWEFKNEKFNPLYTERVNRQYLDPIFVENGAFVISTAEIIKKTKSRIGPRLEIFCLSDNESIDIDNKNDWTLAESIIHRKKIAFVTKGDFHIGMGHIYRCLTLAARLNDQYISFFSPADAEMGIHKIESLNYNVNKYHSEDELLEMLQQNRIDIVINDFLDTSLDYIKRLRGSGFFVVNFEDTGDGFHEADLIFNALYEWSGAHDNAFYGYKYECLRDDIYMFPIKRLTKRNVENILIGFGGTDINNSTLKTLTALDKIINNDIQINVLLGIGYKFRKELDEQINNFRIKENIKIHEDIPFVAELLYRADVIISGNGRMVYEAVAIGTPLIVGSQNDNEMTHIFAKICPGIKYLGNINSYSSEQLQQELLMVNNSSEKRANMNAQLFQYAVEIRRGIETIIDIMWKTFKRER